jgi:hypothetical protein
LPPSFDFALAQPHLTSGGMIQETSTSALSLTIVVLNPPTRVMLTITLQAYKLANTNSAQTASVVGTAAYLSNRAMMQSL